MKQIKNWEQFLNEGLIDYQLNNILDKISELGIDSLSNHEKTLLKSYSDKSIDTKEEIQKHNNKYLTSKEVIETIPLKVSDDTLKRNIGRYVKFKREKDYKQRGLLAHMGIIYEIVSIQKHWGYVDGVYGFHKIGYRLAEVGNDGDFGRVGDVDEIIFVNISEDEAIKINRKISKKLKERQDSNIWGPWKDDEDEDLNDE